MRSWLPWPVATLLLVVSGCSYFHYELELCPDGDQMVRRLTCWKTTAGDKDSAREDFPADELKAITEIYQSEIAQPLQRKYVFEGAFGGTTPQDIGGAGWFRRFQSPLGDSFWYTERFRGRDDLVVQLEERAASADQLADLLKGWFTAELGNEPEFASAIKIVDVDLRHDLKNFGTYTWASMSVPGHWSSKEETNGVETFFVGAVQYFIERGYLTPDELPAMQRSMNLGFEELAGRAVLCKSGLLDSHAEDPRLDFLRGGKRTKESWARYMQTTPSFRAQLDAWEIAKQSDPELSAPDPQEPLMNLVSELVGFELFGRSDHLNLTLHTPVRPFLTNATWNETKKTANWDLGIAGDKGVPTLVYAQWAVPNEEVQSRLFGAVILADDQLAQYVEWYTVLNAEQRAEWDKFFEQLRPGPGLAKQVADFQFREESAESRDETVVGYLQKGRDLLARALMQHKPEKEPEN
ncbi:MAG: hypothetical protein KF708_17625 [Pirellulales bacterium]|nr:hypothetical protein [Pirellulales bacterium]